MRQKCFGNRIIDMGIFTTLKMFLLRGMQSIGKMIYEKERTCFITCYVLH